MMYRMWEVVKAYQQLNDFEDATNALQQLLGEFKDTVPTFTGWWLRSVVVTRWSRSTYSCSIYWALLLLGWVTVC